MAKDSKSSRARKSSTKKPARSAEKGKFVEDGALKHSSITSKHKKGLTENKGLEGVWTVNESWVAYPAGKDPNQEAISSNEDARFMKSVLIISRKPEVMMTPMEKMELAEKGVPKTALENFKDKADLDYDQLSQLLNVARTTLIAKKGREKFSQDVSDKILGLADIYSYGYEVFEERERFNEWIFRPNKALGGKAPFDILHNSFGKEEVKNLIGRIDYGIYS